MPHETDAFPPVFEQPAKPATPDQTERPAASTTPLAWIGLSVDKTEGPTSTLARGESSIYTFEFTWIGLIKTLVFRLREIKIHVQVLDIEVPDDSQRDTALAALIGTCQGLIECFEENDPWTPEARRNAAAELRKGIKEVTHGA